jgi:hypothetical protein
MPRSLIRVARRLVVMAAFVALGVVILSGEGCEAPAVCQRPNDLQACPS